MINWLAIKANEMMRTDMKYFVTELKVNGIKYESYSHGGKYLYIKILNPTEYSDHLIEKWLYYHPITVLKKKPKVSDYDITDW